MGALPSVWLSSHQPCSPVLLCWLKLAQLTGSQCELKPQTQVHENRLTQAAKSPLDWLSHCLTVSGTEYSVLPPVLGEGPQSVRGGDLTWTTDILPTNARHVSCVCDCVCVCVCAYVCVIRVYSSPACKALRKSPMVVRVSILSSEGEGVVHAASPSTYPDVRVKFCVGLPVT